MTLPRLRQVVLAARDLDAVAGELEAALAVHDPFNDAGVGHFGLRNAVYTLGDSFVEIVSPVQDGTPAGRYLDRRGGDCGYMAMFEADDATELRKRLAATGVRVVWESVHDDIVDLHLHPKDMSGAIVAIDVTDPPGSWRWGGPRWTAAVPPHGPERLLGLTVAAVDPLATARRWAAVIGVAEPAAEVVPLETAGQQLRFVEAADERAEGIVGVDVAVTGATGAVDIGGVRFNRLGM